jgi:hypothetical protein
MGGDAQNKCSRTCRVAPPKATKMSFGAGNVVLSQVSEWKPGAPLVVLLLEFSRQILHQVQDDSAGGVRSGRITADT